jgi:hypothetical protein
VLPPFGPPDRPVFILGCPRSGTSLLLQALLRSDALGSVQGEGHILWDEFHDPRRRGWDSDAMTADDVTEREREYVYCAIRLFVRRHRLIDKTPANCLRVDYLNELFPDAQFVFLRRRADATVNSLMEAWRARPRFVRYRLPETLTGLGPLSGNLWSFVLVPHWRELRTASLEEICAHQYVACNEAVLAARAADERPRWIDVAYEHLVESPVAVLGMVYEELGLEFPPSAKAFAEGLATNLSSTSLTAPRPEKWMEQNPDAIERVRPIVADVERRLGYSPGETALAT